MLPLLRTALVWILALALPMQVLATATMRHCSHAPAAPVAVHDPCGHAAAVGHADSATPRRHAAHAARAVADDRADHEDAHQCSACAACCAGAALPGAALPLATVDPARPLLRSPPLLETSVLLPGIERPPRRTPVA